MKRDTIIPFIPDHYLEFLGPESLTILTTYACTAACRECCFHCHPKKEGRLSLSQIKDAIEEAKTTFKSLKFVVFSGGEAFLLGRDLYQAMEFVADLGLGVRVVSNGYWAKTATKAKSVVDCLFEAGLSELNISTGDDHQEWVPFENVVNAMLASASAGIRTVITVEMHKNSVFVFKDAIEHPRVKDFFEHHPNKSLLSIVQSTWIEFTGKDRLQFDDVQNRLMFDENKMTGCENVIDNMVLTQTGEWASCCGLTLDKIRELKLGKQGQVPFKDIFTRQLHDLLKVWIKVEGPERILLYLAKCNPSIEIKKECLVHPCQACHYLYHDPVVRKTLMDVWSKKASDIYFKYLFLKYPKNTPQQEHEEISDLQPTVGS